MKRIMLGIFILIPKLGLGANSAIGWALTHEPTDYIVNFFGTIVLLILLDLNIKKVLPGLKRTLRMFYQHWAW
ncbi:MAG: hypothetical protein HQM09_09000 [Candidatus Riflebacteria bacterium]|nr:hypothetical protein [Candidatus Riflebacteria bacterium]